ncbi:ArsR/SmtB family transcription factor [Nocardioides ferulae]|uniref:ArsR/SmtB family transcription factor n=1 Tax=Nocardioides ferulae TaxID=2340821 RepID=UPI000EB17538|nr:helix-turn-helix domain-containing protein [Nocardioides ferulae]
MADDETAALRSLAHPVRLQILSLLTGTAMSAAEVARELELTHANASYHLRVLAAAGEVVEAGEERIRGGVAKRYRHPWREVFEGESAQPGRVSPEHARMQVRAMSSELVRRFDRRRAGAPASLTDAELWVEPEVWEQVRGLVMDAAALLHDQARPPHAEGTVRVNLTAAAFTMETDR